MSEKAKEPLGLLTSRDNTQACPALKTLEGMRPLVQKDIRDSLLAIEQQKEAQA